MDSFILAIKSYNLNVKIHKHAAYQIIISIDKPFDTIIDGISTKCIYGFIIKPQVPHLCILAESTLMVINVEAYSFASSNLRSFFLNDHEKAILFSKPNDLSKYFELNGSMLPEDVTASITRILNKERTDIILDDRIVKIIAHVKNNYYEKLSIKLLANLVYLSPSRLTSLFKNQTGSSLSKFILWTRLRQAIILSLTDKKLTLTEIAYETGFYDLPQFNKYMYEMIGVPPLALKQNSDLIQVF